MSYVTDRANPVLRTNGVPEIGKEKLPLVTFTTDVISPHMELSAKHFRDEFRFATILDENALNVTFSIQHAHEDPREYSFARSKEVHRNDLVPALTDAKFPM